MLRSIPTATVVPVAAVAMIAMLARPAARADVGTAALALSAGDNKVLTPGAPPKTAASLIHEYIGSQLPLWSDPNATAAQEPMPAVSIDTMVVTLPDPRASRFANSFDDRLGGLQRAAEAAGYQLDRFYLPWSADSKDDERGVEQPGVFLFRRRQPETLLVVWVVGETPTTGVHKVALAKALNEAAAFLVPPGPGQPPAASSTCVGPLPSGVTPPPAGARELRVLAPTFSGSWRSLDQTLRLWSGCVERATGTRPALRVMSGSATAIPATGPHGEFQVAGTTFQATILRDGDSLDALLQYLCAEQNIDADRVALLVEANTAYGQALSREPRRRACDEQKAPRMVRFPLHIAQLRQASQSNAASRSNGGTATAQPTQSLSRVVLDSERPMLETPATQGRLTEAAVDVQLKAALETLAGSAVAYVGIMASDIQDTIVLAREVRKHAPNTTLFTLSNDVVFLHADVNPSLLGTLFISTYPLVPSARRVRSDRGYVPFATDRDVGVYNAFLALMDRDELIEYGVPPGNDPSRPAYWMSIVGRDAFWPIRPLEHASSTPTYYYERQRNTAPARLDVDSPIQPRFQLVYVAWCFACALLMYAVGLIPASRAPSGISHFPTERFRAARELRMVSTCATLLGIHVLLSAIFVVPLNVARLEGVGFVNQAPGWTILSLVVGLPAMIGLGTGLAWIMARSIAGVVRRRRLFVRAAWASVAVNLAASAGATLLVLWVVWRWLGQSPVEQVFLAARAAAWTSGVSPVAPLILIGAAALCSTLGTLRRVRLCDEFIPIARGPKTFDAIRRSEKAIQRAFACETSAIPNFWPIAGGFAVPCVALFMTRFARPAETGPYLWLFGVGFVGVYLALVMEFARFVYGWTEVKGYLRRLAWHPTSVMFASLSSETQLPTISLTHSSHVMTALTFGVAIGRRFVNAVLASPVGGSGAAGQQLRPLAATLNAKQEHAEAALAAAAAHDAERADEAAVQERRRAHRDVSTLVSQAMNHLDALWPHMPGKPEGTASDEEKLLAAGGVLVAARAVTVLHFAFLHLQNLITFVTSGLLLMLFAVTLYPFQPHGWLLVFNWTLVTLVIVSAIGVFVQMDRDRVMSLLSKTTPGTVTFDKEFFLRIFLFVIVPLLGMLGANFPDGLRQALDWVRGGQPG